jgi:hypothetical protein
MGSRWRQTTIFRQAQVTRRSSRERLRLIATRIHRGNIMAFLDFTQPLGTVSTGIAAPRTAATVEADFDPREWRVIRFARQDSLSTLREPSRLDRFIELLFGERPNPQLADSRLEALRRLAVEAWHRGYAVRLSAIAAFREAGFSMAQLELLLAAIGAGRDARGRRFVA